MNPYLILLRPPIDFRGGTYPCKIFLEFESTYNLLGASCCKVGIGRFVMLFEFILITL